MRAPRRLVGVLARQRYSQRRTRAKLALQVSFFAGDYASDHNDQHDEQQGQRSERTEGEGDSGIEQR
jgi:hypothetical protein